MTLWIPLREPDQTHTCAHMCAHSHIYPACIYMNMIAKYTYCEVQKEEISVEYCFLKDSLEKDSDAGRDWGQEEKGTTEDETAGWHYRLDGRESE